MGRVIFMCGPAGSGKSTIARQYEQQGMVRLSFDQEAWSRGITTMPLPDDVRRDVEHVLRARLADLVQAGSDVVLDFSFWSRRMRDEYREFLRPFGVVPETVYLATDRATVLQRIAARAALGGDDFKISTELAAYYFDHFEVPAAAEGPLTIMKQESACPQAAETLGQTRTDLYRGRVLSGPRLRQVALVARDCDRVAGEVRQAFGLAEPFHDPGVGQFGLTNAVFAVGDTFLEVVAPARPDTTAGRYLERRGGDGGYMAIFQVPDLTAARRRLADLGVRVVWTADLPDIAGTHLHPRDVPGAIVSLDWAEPAQSWRWAGPSWTGRAPDHAPGGLTGLTIEVSDPAAAADRWAAVLGIPATDAVVELPDPGQRLRFVPARAGHGEGITEVTIDGLPGRGPWVIGGVRFAGEG